MERGYPKDEMLPAERGHLTLERAVSYGEVFARSRYFTDAKDAAQAAVKILAGSELGMGPMTAMMNLDIIPSQRGPTISIRAHAMAALVRNSGRYDYQILESSNTRCRIKYLRRKEGTWRTSKAEEWETLGEQEWTWDDATRAKLNGKATFQQNPSDMLYNRCQAKGVRKFCPDVLGGAVYIEGEVEPLPEPRAAGNPLQRRAHAVEVVGRVVPTAPETKPKEQQRTATDEGRGPASGETEVGHGPAGDASSVAPALFGSAEPAHTFLDADGELRGSVPDESRFTGEDQPGENAAPPVPDAASAPPAPLPGGAAGAGGEAGARAVEHGDLPEKGPVDEVLTPQLGQRVLEAFLVDPEASVSEELLREVHLRLAEFMGGGDAGKAGAKAAWQAVGVTPRKGATVQAGRVVSLCRHLCSRVS